MSIFSHDKAGRPECPYIERWIADFKVFSIRLHHWLASDDQRYFHDHAWWFVSFLFWGSYIERTPQGETIRHAPSIRFYPALHQHIVIVKKPCWTLLLTGKESRKYGYWVNGRFRKRNKYFYEHGLHPCDKP